MNDSYSQWRTRRREESKLAYAALMKFYPLTLDDLPDEVWLPVPEYEGYQVSNFGRVKSFKSKMPRIIKPDIGRGYLRVSLSKDDKKKHLSVHRLVALAFIPNSEEKTTVNHKDGIKFNCHVSNLEWATSSENRQHSIATGLQKSGQDNYLAKLTNEQALYIRENPESLTTYALADLFEVNKSTISKIQRGKSYKKAGGSFRKAQKRTTLTDDLRNQIRAEYVYGSADFGSYGLAKKYGVSQKTVLNIVRE